MEQLVLWGRLAPQAEARVEAVPLCLGALAPQAYVELVRPDRQAQQDTSHVRSRYVAVEVLGHHVELQKGARGRNLDEAQPLVSLFASFWWAGAHDKVLVRDGADESVNEGVA
jgi:hypothetical protein